MTITTNIIPDNQPTVYPFRRATPDAPKTQDELLREASIVASVAELRDVERKMGKEQPLKDYLSLMTKIDTGKATLKQVEGKRIKHQNALRKKIEKQKKEKTT